MSYMLGRFAFLASDCVSLQPTACGSGMGPAFLILLPQLGLLFNLSINVLMICESCKMHKA